MSLEPGVWYETCDTCLGEGCVDCGMEGLVPHGSQPDELAALQAQDDQIKAGIARDAELVGHFRSKLEAQGLTPEQIGPLLDSFYMDYLLKGEQCPSG